VSWKLFEAQPVGWSPNLNEGVRLNIRHFIERAGHGPEGHGSAAGAALTSTGTGTGASTCRARRGITGSGEIG